MSSPFFPPSAAQAPRSTAIVNAQVLVMGELRRLDIGIEDGVIVELAPGLAGSYPQQIDAQGLVALPGLVETAPLADLEAASEAAVRGGVTTLFAVAPPLEPWEAAIRRWEGRCHVDFAVFLPGHPARVEELRALEGQLGFAGPWLGGGEAAPFPPGDLQALLRSGRLRAAAPLGPEQSLLPLLDAAMQALRPLHVVALHGADQLSELLGHPARRLTSAAVALGALLGGDPDAEQLLQALRAGDAALLTSGAEAGPPSPEAFAPLASWLPHMLQLLAHSQITLPELDQWCAHKPAQAFQLQGKGGLLPGLDGDVVLVDLPRAPIGQAPAPGAVVRTISRGMTVWAGGEASPERCGAPVRLARPLAILPR